MTQHYKFLDNINFPFELRKVSEKDLQEVSDEVRKEMINAVSETGGHLGAGLGVVELTVALGAPGAPVQRLRPLVRVGGSMRAPAPERDHRRRQFRTRLRLSRTNALLYVHQSRHLNKQVRTTTGAWRW